METSIHCVTDDVLVQLLDGNLPPDQRFEMLGHVSECAGCRTLIAEVLKETGPEGDEDGGDFEPWDDGWSPPRELDGLRLERKLGKGAMGVVYLAWDKSLERRVAVKFIASEEPRRRELLETEARSLARLHHPNVVTIHSFGRVDGRPYIVAEYVEGRNLAEIQERLPWKRVLGIALGLSRGLEAVHNRGLLHRDIKAANVVVTKDGEVKLLDFGLAAPYGGGGAGGHCKDVAGTPYYMARELFLGVPASPQSDLYALGVLLTELLRGQVIERWTGAPEEALAGLEEGIDPDFVAQIACCLDPDPARRPASAEALTGKLRRLYDAYATEAELLSGNPYRGLAPFEAEHRAVFFGRNDDVRAVAERLERQPIVIIAGDSGVGKSSLCRAGVLPHLAARAKEAGRKLECLMVVPGRRPLHSLAAAIAPVLGAGVEVVARALAKSPATVAQELRALGGAERGGLLLFVDQVEELITMVEQEHVDCFARFLCELALPAAAHVRVLLAVRGDYLTRISALPVLGDEVQGAFHLLRHMSPAGVREAIVGPARSRGVVFESQELIDALVASARGPGSLPLLQFALAELWDHRDAALNRITRTKLDEMGGVSGALSRHADEVLNGLDGQRVNAARQIFLHLVTKERTRIERSEEELATNPRKRSVIPVLVNGRLLHARAEAGRTTYQIAHDSLIGGWATLRGWLDVDSTLLPIRQRLKAASDEWERLKHARDARAGWRLLADSDRLDSDSLSRRERLFLDVSRRAAHRRLLMLWTAPVAAVLAVALALVLVMLVKDKRNREAANEPIEKAKLLLGRAAREALDARRTGEDAIACFEGRPRPGIPSADLQQVAEDLWSQALRSLGKAQEDWAEANDYLKSALQRDPGNPEARRALVRLLSDRTFSSEWFLHAPQRADRNMLTDLVESDGDLPKVFDKIPLALQIDSSPAEVEISRIEGFDRARRLVRVEDSLPAPLDLPMEAGSYLLRITRAMKPVIELPLLLAEGHPARIHIPDSVPDGYVYIPAGCSLEGSDPMTEGTRASPPLHQVCLEQPFLVSKAEVTFADWIDYLENAPKGKKAWGLLATHRYGLSDAAVTLLYRGHKGWEFTFRRRGAQPLRAAYGERLVYPARTTHQSVDWTKLPLVGVSPQDLEPYFKWLEHSGLQGARLCTEREWERAARGADDRAYPHGDRLLPEEANIDVTYGRDRMAMGLDEVGSHPESDSLYGVHDMAGNAAELVQPLVESPGTVVYRGGDWAHPRASALIEARQILSATTLRDSTLGVRVCAPYSPHIAM